MKTRILSAVVGLPIVMFALYIGGVFLYAILFLATSFALYEFNRAFKIEDRFFLVLPICISFFYSLGIWFKSSNVQFMLTGIYILILLFYYVFKFPKVQFKEVLTSFFGYFYVVVMLAHILLIRQDPQLGAWMIWLVFIIAFGSDSSAYFIGVFFGKHQLTKDISPKKTKEGAVGGLFGSALLCVAFAGIMMWQGVLTETHYLLTFALIGIVGSAVSQVGDLAASALKRENIIKDFGKILPGHGGLLDRLDSIIFTAPFVYYIVTFIL